MSAVLPDLIYGDKSGRYRSTGRSPYAGLMNTIFQQFQHKPSISISALISTQRPNSICLPPIPEVENKTHLNVNINKRAGLISVHSSCSRLFARLTVSLTQLGSISIEIKAQNEEQLWATQRSTSILDRSLLCLHIYSALFTAYRFHWPLRRIPKSRMKVAPKNHFYPHNKF